MFAVSDVVWQAVIAGVVTIIVGWTTRKGHVEIKDTIEIQTRKLEEAARVTAGKLEEAARVTAGKLEETALLAAKKVEELAIKNEAQWRDVADPTRPPKP